MATGPGEDVRSSAARWGAGACPWPHARNRAGATGNGRSRAIASGQPSAHMGPGGTKRTRSEPLAPQHIAAVALAATLELSAARPIPDRLRMGCGTGSRTIEVPPSNERARLAVAGVEDRIE